MAEPLLSKNSIELPLEPGLLRSEIAGRCRQRRPRRRHELVGDGPFHELTDRPAGIAARASGPIVHVHQKRVDSVDQSVDLVAPLSVVGFEPHSILRYPLVVRRLPKAWREKRDLDCGAASETLHS